MTLLQLNPPLPLVTPKGKGLAYVLIDYGRALIGQTKLLTLSLMSSSSSRRSAEGMASSLAALVRP